MSIKNNDDSGYILGYGLVRHGTSGILWTGGGQQGALLLTEPVNHVGQNVDAALKSGALLLSSMKALWRVLKRSEREVGRNLRRYGRGATCARGGVGLSERSRGTVEGRSFNIFNFERAIKIWWIDLQQGRRVQRIRSRFGGSLLLPPVKVRKRRRDNSVRTWIRAELRYVTCE